MDDSTKKAALSGAASGGVMGLIGAGMGGSGLKKALRAALLGSGVGATVAGGGTALGSSVLGSPGEGEINPYTRRAALGGGIAGAGIGAALSAALAKKWLKINNPPLSKIFAGKSPGKSALLGGAVGGLFGGYQGGDEGMQLDFIQNEIDALARKRKADELAKRIMEGGLPYE